MLNHNLLLADDGYNIQRSLRLRKSASAYLSRTPTTSGSQQKFTLSFWAKLGSFATGADSFFWSIGDASTGGLNPSLLWKTFDGTYYLVFDFVTGGALRTNAVLRDPSAWYHIVIHMDTTQATAANRGKIFINGVEASYYSASYPAQNTNMQINTSSYTAYLGALNVSGSLMRFFDGYLTDINFIDGQALTPSSFGETDALTGVWKPKKYGGTYGTNGFYLPFSDNTSTTTLGYDKSGNSNNWTCNNISLTAGSTYDSMTDVPTLTSATAANYCVLNPLNRAYSTYTLSDGNLNWTSGTVNQGSFGTIQLPTSGKYYWEVVMTANAGGNPLLGIGGGNIEIGTIGAYYRTNGLKEQYGGVSGNGSSSYGATWTTNDVIGIAYDADTSGGQITFYKNNSSQGVAFTGLTANFPNGLFAGFQNNATGTTTFQANFGQRPFAYTPPTGFVALNTFNLPEPSIKAGNKHFDATAYAGTGGQPQTITNSGSFQPDFIWIKNRSTGGYGHSLQDVVRGFTTGKKLRTDQTSDEGNATYSPDTSGYVTAIQSNGFQLTYAAGGDARQTHNSNDSYVAWQWKAGGSAVSNTAGSITSQVSANPTAGFSVVTYTGNGTNGATVGHGLGVAPSMIILKARNAGSTDWPVYHKSIGNTGALLLNTTNQVSTSALWWNNTSPTSSVFSLGTIAASNTNTQTQVAYCFSEVAGYSKFGSYTGNGSTDGPFVHLGFRPKFLIIKSASAVSNWNMFDSKRDTYNMNVNSLVADSSDADANWVNFGNDFLSNGFKVRTNWANLNTSGNTYIYMAFAENPFKYSLAR